MIVSSTKNGIPSSIPNFKESRGIKVFKLVVGTNFEVDVKHFRRSKQNTCQKAFILRKLFVQNSRYPVIHCEVEGRRWPLADPLILTYEAWCLTVKRQCHVHSDSHNLALNSNFKPRDGAEEGGAAIRVKKESRVENYNLLWFLILHIPGRRATFASSFLCYGICDNILLWAIFEIFPK